MRTKRNIYANTCTYCSTNEVYCNRKYLLKIRLCLLPMTSAAVSWLSPPSSGTRTVCGNKIGPLSARTRFGGVNTRAQGHHKQYKEGNTCGGCSQRKYALQNSSTWRQRDQASRGAKTVKSHATRSGHTPGCLHFEDRVPQ